MSDSAVAASVKPHPPTHHLARRLTALTLGSTLVIAGLARLVITRKVSVAAVLIAALLLVGLSPIVGAYVWLYSSAAHEAHEQLRNRKLPAGDRIRTLHAMSWVTRGFWLPFAGILLVLGLQAVLPEIFTNSVTGGIAFALFISVPVGVGIGMNHYWRAWLAETMTVDGAAPARSLPAMIGSVPADPPEQVFHCGVVSSVTRSVWRNRYEVAIYLTGIAVRLRHQRPGAPLAEWFIAWDGIEGCEDVSFWIPSRYGNADIHAVRIVLRQPRTPLVLWAVNYKINGLLKAHGVAFEP